MNIENCVFTVEVLNKDAVNSIEAIAEAFRQNAEGLTELAKIFSSSQIKIESMLKVDHLNEFAEIKTTNTEKY